MDEEDEDGDMADVVDIPDECVPEEDCRVEEPSIRPDEFSPSVPETVESEQLMTAMAASKKTEKVLIGMRRSLTVKKLGLNYDRLGVLYAADGLTLNFCCFVIDQRSYIWR